MRNQEGIVSNSKVYFTSHVPVNTMVGGPTPLKMKRILDMVILFSVLNNFDRSFLAQLTCNL